MAEDKRRGPVPTIPARSSGENEPEGRAPPTRASRGDRSSPAPPTVASSRDRSAAPPTARPGARSSRRSGPRFVGANDRYELGRVLGKGGFGRVYEAYDHTMRLHVAVKTLNVSDLEDDELETFLRKFGDEARQIHPLENSGIVRVKDFGGEEVGQPFIVMQLIEGGTLRDRLKREGGALEPEEVVEIGVAVAEALEYVHQRHILHRDIKPENIFCVGDGTYKVGDFGIASYGVSRGTRSTFRGAGTPAYMSPEQILAPATVDGRSDTFSLCVVLYEALSGERPYLPLTLDFDPEESDRSSQRARRAVGKNFREFTPLLDLAPRVPPALAAVIERGIDPDPEKRFSSCAALAQALRSSLKVKASPPTKQRKKSRVGWVLGGGLATAVTALGVSYVLAGNFNGWRGGDNGNPPRTPGQPNVALNVAVIDGGTPTPSPWPTEDAGLGDTLGSQANGGNPVPPTASPPPEIVPTATTTTTPSNTPTRTSTPTSTGTATPTSSSTPEPTTRISRPTPPDTPTIRPTPRRSNTPTPRPTPRRTDTPVVPPTPRWTDTPVVPPTPRRTGTPTRPPNRTPVISGSPRLNPQAVIAGQSMKVSIEVPVDPEGRAVTCRWLVDGVPLTPIGPCGGRWDKAIEGMHELTLEARGTDGMSAAKTWTLPVRAAQIRPTQPPAPPAGLPIVDPQQAAYQLVKNECVEHQDKINENVISQPVQCTCDGIDVEKSNGKFLVNFNRKCVFPDGAVLPDDNPRVQIEMTCTESGCVKSR